MIEVVPALLCYSKDELMSKISSLKGIAPAIQIDIMDGIFVKNKTVGLDGIKAISWDREIEYHLMVNNPHEYIENLPGGANSIFQVHIESVGHQELLGIIELVKRKGSKLGLVLNPSTPIEKIEPYLPGISFVLLMTVVPGLDGQSYIKEVEDKIISLRRKYPGITIEVDGGLDGQTVPSAVRAGANRIVAASAIFKQGDVRQAWEKLREIANSQI